MSFLAEIQSFKRSQQLRATDTSVTLESGVRYMETHDESGQSQRTLVAPCPHEFMCIGDGKPDLQIGQVLPGLLLASQDVAGDLELLKTNAITHILNVAFQVESFFPDDFTYKRLDIRDLPETNILNYFPECFKFLDQGMDKGKVLVHCNAGVSRSASVVIGYLMNRRRMSFLDAYNLVKETRPAIRPNDGFMQQLKCYKPL